MDQPSYPRRTFRPVRWLTAGLCLILAAPALAQDPNLDEALAAAVRQLREIAEPGLRDGPATLPRPLDADLWSSERSFFFELRKSDPDGWSAEDRKRAGEILDRLPPLWQGGDSDAESGHHLQTSSPAVVRDRLAIVEGRWNDAITGIEERLEVALGLARQADSKTTSGALHLARLALEDLQRITLDPTVDPTLIDHLGSVLDIWRSRVPTPAVDLAMGTLADLGELGEPAEEPVPPLAALILAEESVGLARACQRGRCRDHLDEIEASDSDPLRKMMVGSLVGVYLISLEQLGDLHRIAELAQLAIALRLEGARTGSYPETAERETAQLGFSDERLAALDYRRQPDGGAVLTTDSEMALASDWTELLKPPTDLPTQREQVEALLVWELPALCPPASAEQLRPGCR